MRNIHAPILLLVAFTILVPGCKKDDPTPVSDLGYGYFPTRIGNWVEYNVDSTRVTGSTTTSWNYAIREVLTEEFTDNEGRPAQRLTRYLRDSASNWVPKDVWWQTRDAVRAERSEENKRRVKLVFPPRSTSVWNTNATNTNEEFELVYEDIDEPWSANGLAFDSTLLVASTYPSNLVFTKNQFERYAKHVGLVYREVDSSETQSGSFERYRVVYTVTAYGQ